MIESEKLCARVAAGMGGGAAIPFDPAKLFQRPSPSLPPLVRAAELVVGVFCVGETFSVAIIPHTRDATTLGELQIGDRINLETDILAKHVEKLLGGPR